ncbi:MAG: family 20 glycosylhydrolase [Phycisphaerae bacterium]|nr:family 20 glycosylhydrolase [Phycisphaerae bacterium]
MPNAKVLIWDEPETPAELKSLLDEIGKFYSISKAKVDGAITVEFEKGGPEATVQVILQDSRARIIYDRPHHAARGLGALLSGLVQDGEPYLEQTPFETLGIMLDCSRNAVMTVEHFKGWLRQLALLGYNMAMLYTEETYELPGEEYFGYLRGRYSPDELKEIDRYAAGLNIEMVGCIQTLGHLGHLLKWPAYARVKDTPAVILVDEDGTYQLIEKMITQFCDCFQSRRIHIGMDEAHDLGRGKFMDLKGYERGYDLFNRHLGRVVGICKRHGLKPMIWSDMYFSMGCESGDYYDPKTVIPANVKASIPTEVELVYWDYYHDNETFYLDWIERHRKLDKEPIMASGIWTCVQFWYNHQHTQGAATACISACRKSELKEIFFTMWADEGAYCEFDSALAGMTYCAEQAYATGHPDEKKLAARFSAICGADYHAVLEASELNQVGNPSSLMWDDPILNVEWKERKKKDSNYWAKAVARASELADKLSVHAETVAPIDLAYARNVVEYLKRRIDLSLKLEKSYLAGDKAGLSEVRKLLPGVIESIDALLISLRRQWLRRNKPFGLEVLQQRFGGTKQRYLELDQRLSELIAGEIDEIAELAEGL